MKTILVPTDFSKAARKAVDLGATLARQFDATLVLLHVLEGVEEGSFNVEGEALSSTSWEDRIFTLKLLQKSKRQLAQLEELVKGMGVKTISVMRMGSAYHGMETIIAEQKVDLVVMGTRGSSGYAEAMVGSNTEKVVRRAACPVLAVNEKSTASPLKSIVWATSLRQEDLTAPTVLRELINQKGTTVHLVRINTPGWFIPDTLAKPKLEDFAKAMRLKNYTINVFNDFTEEDGIIHFASAIGADLISLSTHGRKGLAHLLNGSIAEDLVNHARRPVLTYVIGKNATKK
jgi:nucleotide-binding universal stress UspA family protein